MNIVLLKDLEDGCVDGIIIADKSTKEDIENAINKAKENNDYQWDDLLKSLPNDCVVYDKWNNLETVYY